MGQVIFCSRGWYALWRAHKTSSRSRDCPSITAAESIASLRCEAPLSPVYGLLFDNVSGRLLLHDGAVVERLEPDGSLLTILGFGEYPDESTDGLSPVTCRMALCAAWLRDSMPQSLFGRCRIGPRLSGSRWMERCPRLRAAGSRLPGFRATVGRPPRTDLVLRAAWCSIPRATWISRSCIATASGRCLRPESCSTVYTLPAILANGFPQSVEGLAIDAGDNLYLTEWMGHTVLKLIAPTAPSRPRN